MAIFEENNHKQMKRIAILIAAICMALPSSAKITDKTVIDAGGPGPYKAEVICDSGLEGYSIYRPQDMKAASSVEGKLPVILFGNGGCARNSSGFNEFLTNIASHGYIVVTNGSFYREQPQPRPQAQAAPRPQQQADPEAMRKAMMDGFRKSEAQNVADALDYLNALDYLQKQSQNKKSEYYGAIDTDNVAAMGQSCGGGQALILGTCGDSRIKTTVALNSGVAYLDDENTWMLKKEDLNNLQHPICYIIGGKDDVAYPNAADDFKRIQHVPVAVANLPVGHGGTYGQPHGGEFAEMTLLWLDYRLKGKVENEEVFRYGVIPENLSIDWTMNTKNYDQPQEYHLFKPVENKESASINDFGEVVSYSKVNDPTMTVFLPEKDKANGTAVLIYPGGGLMSLTWGGEGTELAKWLNSKGIAAICVKYRLRQGFGGRPAGNTEIDPNNKFLQMRAQVFDFGDLVDANCNPSPVENDESIINSTADALRAIEIVKQHAAEWNIDPEKIGEIGFSAGGGVELAAMVAADKEHMPAFIATIYGPALVDTKVPENAPELFIAVHADHPNVAAGCMALFMDWKKAGIESEIHVYESGTGNFFGGGRSTVNRGRAYGNWREAFYSWMCANGFAE